MAVLHTEYYRQSGAGQKDIPVNQDIDAYIHHAESEDFSEIIRQDNRFLVFYHLSQMRTSILNWYEFDENADVLEIGGEFGALTGMLCDRCRHVTTVEYGLFKAQAIVKRYKHRENLDVYAGVVTEMSFAEGTFDYIVMIGCLERQCGGSQNWKDYADYLEAVGKLLKPGGRLLLAVDNRYGVRFLCGERDAYTGLPFSGLNHYARGSKGYTFSRQELIHITEEAGFPQQKFFYPLPDYKLPQMIYTDGCLPKKDLAERVLFYHRDRKTLIAQEETLYADIVENDAFPFLSNSFLIECGKEQAVLSTTTFAAVTTDRGRQFGLATSFHQEQGKRLVKKAALYPEGEDGVFRVYENLMRLKEHGVPIVPHQMTRRGVEMPYVQDMTCSDYLRYLAEEGTQRELFAHIFEMIYQNILKSSEHVPSEQNALPEAREIKTDYGVILKKCYVDMVPFNCFYVEEELQYFDQEFVKENYPALYPMYRAIMYTYAFIPQAEAMMPLEEMKERYGLTVLWDVFRNEEDRFVAANRRYDVYAHFYTWLGSDPEQIYQNAVKLSN